MVGLDHLIVPSRDKHASATFLADLLGLPPPTPAGKFLTVALDGTNLDFADAGDAFLAQHYAVALPDAAFDAALSRLQSRSIPYWADPQRTQPDTIALRGSSRAVYFVDPSGHWLEVLTAP